MSIFIKKLKFRTNIKNNLNTKTISESNIKLMFVIFLTRMNEQSISHDLKKNSYFHKVINQILKKKHRIHY